VTDDNFIEEESQRQEQEDMGPSSLSDDNEDTSDNILSAHGLMWSFADVCNEPTGKMPYKQSRHSQLNYSTNLSHHSWHFIH